MTCEHCRRWPTTSRSCSRIPKPGRRSSPGNYINQVSQAFEPPPTNQTPIDLPEARNPRSHRCGRYEFLPLGDWLPPQIIRRCQECYAAAVFFISAGDPRAVTEDLDRAEASRHRASKGGYSSRARKCRPPQPSDFHPLYCRNGEGVTAVSEHFP